MKLNVFTSNDSIGYTGLNENFNTLATAITATQGNIKMKSVADVTYKTVSVTLGGPQDPDWVYLDKVFKRLAFQGMGCIFVTLHGLVDGPTGNQFVRPSVTNIQKVIDLAIKYNVPIAMMKPHVVTIVPHPDLPGQMYWNDGFNRKGVIPANNDLFFSNWEKELVYICNLAQNNHIPYVSVSCEQPNQTNATQYVKWAGILSRLRTTYSNLLYTAAFTMEESLNNIQYKKSAQPCLVDLLHVYGFNLYACYTNKDYAEVNGVPSVTVKDVATSYFYSYDQQRIYATLDSLYTLFNKPLFITETGVVPRVSGFVEINLQAPINYKVPALVYEAFFTTVCTRLDMIGFSIWHVDDPFTYCDFDGNSITEAERVILKYIRGVDV